MSPRRKRFRRVGSPPVLKGYKPIGLPFVDTDVVSLLYEEYEALRLADYSGLIHEKAAELMNVSRPTFTRIYDGCLKKIAKAFAEGKSIIIEGGDVEFDKQWYRCNDCFQVFHHSTKSLIKCTSCDSESIENINKSIKGWKELRDKGENSLKQKEYCVCPNCNYEESHQKGLPCFTKICPNCKIPLVRKDK